MITETLTRRASTLTESLTRRSNTVAESLTLNSSIISDSFTTEFTISAGVVAPSAQPTSLTFTNVTTTTMDVSFTASVGGADGYVAFRRTGASPTFVPVDTTTYTVGNTYGDSTCQYFGAGVTFSETGLSASTTYHYDIFAWNGAIGTYTYLTTSPLEGSQTTSAPAFAFGNCLKLDGSNDYGLYTAVDPGTVFSIEFWIKTTDTSAVWWGRNAAGGNEFLAITTAGQVRFKYGVASTEVNTSGMNAIHDGTWRHFAMTRNGSTFRFYLDGANVGGNKTGNTATVVFDQIGAYQATHLLPSNAYFDAWRIYGNYCMSDSDVLAQYNSGLGAVPLSKTPHAADLFYEFNETNNSTTAPDTSGNNNTITFTNLNFDANSGWLSH